VSFIDILFNAAGGGVLGSALHCVTDWLDTKNKIALMNAQVNAAEKTEAWKAFTASQSDRGLQTLPKDTPAWVTAIYVLVQAFKDAMRPLLALCAIIIIASVYMAAGDEARKAMQSEILFGCFTATFWYFGARYSRSSK
jgi:hypothetical protein